MASTGLHHAVGDQVITYQRNATSVVGNTMAKTGRPSGRDPKWNKDKARWELRVSVVGSRGKPSTRLIANAKLSAQDHEAAREWAAEATTLVQAKIASPSILTRTCDEQFELVCKARRDEDNIIDVYGEEVRWAKWISPVIGNFQVRSVNDDDLSKVVRGLNQHVRDGKILSSYAQQLWKIVRRLFSMSCTASYPDLKVRSDNPAERIVGPKRNTDREGTYLYPNEFMALMVCLRVPKMRRRSYALAIYLKCRGSELAGLDLETGVNLAHGFVRLYQQLDQSTGDTRELKTKKPRKFKFEQNIRPLLEAIHRERDGKGKLVKMGTRSMWAKNLRKDLARALTAAGIDWQSTHPELFADDALRRPLSFHDLRHTGITWAAIRGGDLTKIQRAAGHSSQRQTLGYMVEVEVFNPHLFGEVFPPLPYELLVLEGANEASKTTMANPAFHPACPRAAGPAASTGVPEKPVSSESEIPKDAVEQALAEALKAATHAEQWDLVSQLVYELQARRKA